MEIDRTQNRPCRGSALAFECGIVVFDAAWISQSFPPEIIDSCVLRAMINLCLRAFRLSVRKATRSGDPQTPNLFAKGALQIAAIIGGDSRKSSPMDNNQRGLIPP